MSFFKELREAGRVIVRQATVAIGTKKMVKFAENSLPKLSGRSKEAWERIKLTKSTGPQKVSWIEEEEEEEQVPGFETAKIRKVTADPFIQSPINSPTKAPAKSVEDSDEAEESKEQT